MLTSQSEPMRWKERPNMKVVACMHKCDYTILHTHAHTRTHELSH